jgi:hypothetical protein
MQGYQKPVARRRLNLHISGLTNRNLRRWRRTRQKAITPLLLIAGIPVVIALTREQSIELADHTISGQRILLVQDKSGSMNELQATVAQRLSALRNAGIATEVACELSDLEFGDFTACVERLARRNDVDGLYVLADYNWDWNGTGYSCSPQPGDGTRRLTNILRGTGWRLYLETINCHLPQDLANLADESGGGIIHTRK